MRRSVPLRVRSLHLHRQAVQPWLVENTRAGIYWYIPQCTKLSCLVQVIPDVLRRALSISYIDIEGVRSNRLGRSLCSILKVTNSISSQHCTISYIDIIHDHWISKPEVTLTFDIEDHVIHIGFDIVYYMVTVALSQRHSLRSGSSLSSLCAGAITSAPKSLSATCPGSFLLNHAPSFCAILQLQVAPQPEIFDEERSFHSATSTY
jgi:hypothetical protein